ncbi:MAG: endonuclease/exonuclease/phosphatase family protein [Pseudomonadota bacterium]
MATRRRIATWNVCWFTALFDRGNNLRLGDGWSAMHDVTRTRQAEAISSVLRRIDADLYCIIEAPDTGSTRSTSVALSQFVEHFGLRQSQVLSGFRSGTEQEIALLFDPEIFGAEHLPLGQPLDPETADLSTTWNEAPRFDSVFPLDLDGDGKIDLHRFSKPPLEADVTDLVSGRVFRMIGVHAKSKAPHGAATPEAVQRISLRNRRKQLAQCAWLRARIEDHLDRGDDVMVLGDFNDGPGQDKYERVFGRSGVEIVMGSVSDPERILRNPYAWRGKPPYAARPSTARFYNRETKGFLNALLDFIMVSPGFADAVAPEWRIWHPFDDEECYGDEAFQADLLSASDHFPVSIDLTL